MSSIILEPPFRLQQSDSIAKFNQTPTPFIRSYYIQMAQATKLTNVSTQAELKKASCFPKSKTDTISLYPYPPNLNSFLFPHTYYTKFPANYSPIQNFPIYNYN